MIYFPFKIKTIQTDNGIEFTNRLSWQAFLKDKKTMFEKTLEELKKQGKDVTIDSKEEAEQIKNEFVGTIKLLKHII